MCLLSRVLRHWLLCIVASQGKVCVCVCVLAENLNPTYAVGASVGPLLGLSQHGTVGLVSQGTR